MKDRPQSTSVDHLVQRTIESLLISGKRRRTNLMQRPAARCSAGGTK